MDGFALFSDSLRGPQEGDGPLGGLGGGEWPPPAALLSRRNSGHRGTSAARRHVRSAGRTPRQPHWAPHQQYRRRIVGHVIGDYPQSARRDGRTRPRFSRGTATEARHTRARQAGRGTRPVLCDLRKLAPSSRNMAQEPAPTFTLMDINFRCSPPMRCTPLSKHQ